MTIAFQCVLGCVFIPLALTGYAKFGQKGYDNRHPREFLAKLEGKFKRANYAQMNSYEAFAPFAAGVIIAHISGAIQSHLDTLAVVFFISRILYSIFYVMDQHVWRSLVWVLGFGCMVGIYCISF